MDQQSGLPESWKVQLPVFEGPLDLLLHLVKINEVEITDIPVGVICDQFYEYLQLMEELNLDIPVSQVLGLLPTVQTLTGYVISPFITILDQLPPYRHNREVQKVLEIPLLPLLSTHHPEMGYPPKKQMVAYWFLEHRVWGATAKILHQIRRLDSVH